MSCKFTMLYGDEDIKVTRSERHYQDALMYAKCVAYRLKIRESTIGDMYPDFVLPYVRVKTLTYNGYMSVILEVKAKGAYVVNNEENTVKQLLRYKCLVKYCKRGLFVVSSAYFKECSPENWREHVLKKYTQPFGDATGEEQLHGAPTYYSALRMTGESVPLYPVVDKKGEFLLTYDPEDPEIDLFRTYYFWKLIMFGRNSEEMTAENLTKAIMYMVMGYRTGLKKENNLKQFCREISLEAQVLACLNQTEPDKNSEQVFSDAVPQLPKPLQDAQKVLGGCVEQVCEQTEARVLPRTQGVKAQGVKTQATQFKELINTISSLNIKQKEIALRLLPILRLRA